ncbi:MAG: hypothetical protein SFZ02_03235 [bacterium]|nr:hypothetical protein [bacterium]
MPPTHFFMRLITRITYFFLITSLLCAVIVTLLAQTQSDEIIAYIGARPNQAWLDYQFAVNVYDARTRLIVPLTDQSLQAQLFNWSPNGEYIGFLARTHGAITNPSSLYVIRHDGHEPRLISGDLIVIITTERPPYWTLDSQNMIFQAQQTGANIVQFYRGWLDGRPPELLDLSAPQAQDYIQNLFPPYQTAPNGIFQAQVDYRDNQWGLFVVIRGIRTKIHPLAAEEMMPDAPDWSPDSTRIALSQREGGVPMIWVMSLTGEKLFRIERGRYPLWKPVLEG